MTVTLRAQSGELRQVPLHDLVVSKHNPRTDVGDVSELEASIREHGVLEPLIVVAENGHFAVVAGSRRLAAAKRAKLVSVPVVVKEMSDEDQAAAALIENLQRRDLAPLEEARGYRRWLDLTKKTQAELAKSIGKAPSTVANALRLLGAPAPVQKALEDGALTPAHARVLLQLKDDQQIAKVATNESAFRKMTVDQVQERVVELNEQTRLAGPPAVEAARKALEDVKKAHPKATITWRAGGGPDYAPRVDLYKALGKPAAPYAGEIGTAWRQKSAENHAKACGCHGLELYAEVKWGTSKKDLAFGTRRVCIDPKKWQKVQGEKRHIVKTRSSSSEPKPLTPAQVAKQEATERKRVETRVARVFARQTEVPGQSHAIFVALSKRFAKGQIPADVARALLYVASCGMIEGELYGDAEQRIAWARIAKMPAKVASARAATVLASEFTRSSDVNRNSETEAADREVLAYFGVKLPEPKAKKAAQR